MPDKVMRRIIGFGGFQDLFKFRKVCQDLRTFIDETCLNVNCTSLSFTFLPNKISLVANFLDREDEEITYRNQENGCQIQNKPFQKLDFIDAFFKDLPLIMKYLPPCLPRLSFKFQYTNDESDKYIPEVQKNLNSVLRSRKTMLPVRKFIMNAFKEDQVLTILPHLDPMFLEEIWILDSEFWLGVDKILEINELTLRKVCHDFRNFIDDKLPDIGLTSVVIMITPRNISIYYDAGQQSNRLLYLKHDEGCLVKHNDMEYLLENEEFVDLFLKELAQFLNHQKSTLDSLRIICGKIKNEEEYQNVFFPILQKIQGILESKKNQLKVRCINFNAFKPAHVLTILPFIDPIPLKGIIISHPNFDISRESENIFDVKELSHLDQWKSAKVLKILYLNLSPDIRDFLHFNRVLVKIHTVSKELFEFLKEKMLCEPTMLTVFEITGYKRFDEEQEYLSAMEQYKTDEADGGVRKWKIQLPHHKKRLEVVYVPKRRHIVFSQS
ncbi:hypothetical protein CAEBREN_03050 [Caenorhabditis brenneri]|uniref:F-box domain-containing protein n=1 Tax=Caenorhabditis brenneri TaxID=135651 RepID=G0NN64_CAEBE|nr:hypothetical protein CAEBREN_03050 [Caenorhabditis brenneri]